MTAPVDPAEEPQGEAALAMDVALGALSRAELAAARLRMQSDPDFRAAVEAWEERLSPLLDDVAPAPPPADAWQRIEAAIAPPAAAPAASRPRLFASLWNSLAVWRGLAAGAAAAAALLFVQLGGPAPVTAPTPGGHMLVATLVGDDGAALISAAYDPARGAVVLAPAAHPSLAGKSPELWVIEGKAPPRSLGVVDMDAPSARGIDKARLAGLKPGSVLAVSIEPAGGSPTGQPTGPVVAKGTLAAV